MLLEFDAEQVAPRDRIGTWREAVSRNLVDVECRLSDFDDFDGAFAVLATQRCGLATLRGSRHVASRTRACINQFGDDFFMLFLQRAGRMGVSIGDEEIEVRPGDFFFYDARIPHRLSFEGPFDHVALRLPRTVVDQRWRSLRSRGCFQLVPSDPLAHIAAATLDAAASNIRRMSDDDLAVAVENVVDLFSAGAAKIGLGQAAGAIDGGSVPFARARAIVQARLNDDRLGPETIAAEMGISRRTLGKMFEQHGIGIMEYVILERLERAARDLTSPSQRGISVTEIAYRWGFKNTSHFCKRFRDHFGMAPSEVRGG